MTKTLYKGASNKMIYLTINYVTPKDYDEKVNYSIIYWLIREYGLNCHFTTEILNDIIKKISIYKLDEEKIEIEGKVFNLYNNIVIIQNPITFLYRLWENISYSYRSFCIPDILNTPIGGKECEFEQIKFITGTVSFCGTRTSHFIARNQDYGETKDKDYLYSLMMRHKRSLSIEKEKVLKVSITEKNVPQAIRRINDVYGSSAEIILTLEDNYLDAFTNIKNYKWLKIEGVDQSRTYYFRNEENYNIKVFPFFYKGSLILSDSIKSYYDLKDILFKYIEEKGTNIIFLNQYNINKFKEDRDAELKGTYIKYLSETRGDIENIDSKITIYIPNQEKLFNLRKINNFNDDLLSPYDGFNYYVSYMISKNNHKTTDLSILFGKKISYFPQKEDSLVLPYKKNTRNHIECLELFLEYGKAEELSFKKDLKEKIINLIIGVNEKEEDEEDILVSWFNQVTQNKEDEQEKIKKAYKVLRRNLLREYKEIGTYLDNIDLSKKNPIPSIYIDEKAKKVFLSKSSIGIKDNVIKTVNNKMIDIPIVDKEIYLKYICVNKKDESRTSIKYINLKELYNKTNNIIDIKYTELKNDREEI